MITDNKEIMYIRLRPGFYIRKLGDGRNPNDGIYEMLKGIVDNSIDEYVNGYGNQILIDVNSKEVRVRDFGRGISMGLVMEIMSRDIYSDREIGQLPRVNPLGILAVNALSEKFYLCSYCSGMCSWIRFERGVLQDQGTKPTNEKDGTLVSLTPDSDIFGDYAYDTGYVENIVKGYSYLNTGLTLMLNGNPFKSEHGLLDLVSNTTPEEPLYQPIHLIGEDIEVVITHGGGRGEDISSFVNGQRTRCGGTHLDAYREAVQKALNVFLKEKYKRADCLNGLVGAINIKIHEPFFETLAKDRLSSTYIAETIRFGSIFTGQTVKEYVNDFISKNLLDYLRTHHDIALIIKKRIRQSQQERESHIAWIKARKKARAKNH